MGLLKVRDRQSGESAEVLRCLFLLVTLAFFFLFLLDESLVLIIYFLSQFS